MDLIHTIYYGIVIVPLCVFNRFVYRGTLNCYFFSFSTKIQVTNSCGGVFCSILPIHLHIHTSYYCNYGCVEMVRNRRMRVIHDHCSSFCLVFVICLRVVVVIIIIVRFYELTYVFFKFISSSIHKIIK